MFFGGVFFILLQKTGREQMDERGTEDEFRGGGEKKKKERSSRGGRGLFYREAEI